MVVETLAACRKSAYVAVASDALHIMYLIVNSRRSLTLMRVEGTESLSAMVEALQWLVHHDEEELFPREQTLGVLAYMAESGSGLLKGNAACVFVANLKHVSTEVRNHSLRGLLASMVNADGVCDNFITRSEDIDPLLQCLRCNFHMLQS